MSSAYQEVLKLVEALTPTERLDLIAYLATASRVALEGGDERPSWLDLIGSAPYPALGEEAQTWVSRTRQESDDAREAPWRDRS